METTTAKKIGRIPHIDIVKRVAFSKDGSMLATASSRVVQFWDIEKIQQIKKDDLIEAACSRLTENFSEAEWSARFASAVKPWKQDCCASKLNYLFGPSSVVLAVVVSITAC